VCFLVYVFLFVHSIFHALSVVRSCIGLHRLYYISQTVLSRMLSPVVRLVHSFDRSGNIEPSIVAERVSCANWRRRFLLKRSPTIWCFSASANTPISLLVYTGNISQSASLIRVHLSCSRSLLSSCFSLLLSLELSLELS
jgi:hypothetical protein